MLFQWATAHVDEDFYAANIQFEENDTDRLLRAMDEGHGIPLTSLTRLRSTSMQTAWVKGPAIGFSCPSMNSAKPTCS